MGSPRSIKANEELTMYHTNHVEFVEFGETVRRFPAQNFLNNSFLFWLLSAVQTSKHNRSHTRVIWSSVAEIFRALGIYAGCGVTRE